MKFTNEMKNKLEHAASKEEVNDIIAETRKGAESAGVILDDSDLEQASGGAYGSLGMNGMNGMNGMKGSNGSLGMKGSNGSLGLKGSNGKNGMNGMKGMNGAVANGGRDIGDNVGLMNLHD